MSWLCFFQCSKQFKIHTLLPGDRWHDSHEPTWLSKARCPECQATFAMRGYSCFENIILSPKPPPWSQSTSSTPPPWSLTPYQASKTTGTLLFLNEDFTLNIQASPIQGRDGWLLLFPVLRWCQVMSVADVKCFTQAENKKTKRSLLEPFQHKSKVL